MTNEELGQLLSDIANRHDGKLLPKDVVEESRETDHPLHDRFEWDDSIAGEKYREDQARQLIRLAKISVTTPAKISFDLPMFYRDPRSPVRQSGYVPFARVKSDADLAREVVIREFQRVIDALTRAQKVAAVLELQDDVEEVLIRIQALLGHVTIEDRPAGSA